MLLILETILDAAVLLLNLWIVFTARDNRLKRIWGIMSAVLSASLLFDNICFLTGYYYQTIDGETNLLLFRQMIRWYIFAFIFSLFPFGSLHPGWLTFRRQFLFSIPLLCTLLTIFIFILSDGPITPLHTPEDILSHIGEANVQLRIGIFIVSLVHSTIILLIPAFKGWVPSLRRLTYVMYFYITAFLILSVLYFVISFGLYPKLFNLYGFFALTLPAVFSWFYLRHENPFSIPKPSAQQETPPAASAELCQLYVRMNELMRQQTPFVFNGYNSRHLAEDLHANRRLVQRAIRSGGFTGFQEYITVQRIRHFKLLARSLPGSSVKELMLRCGLRSRSDFYRLFTEQESISPTEYLEHLSRPETPAGNRS